MADSPRSHGVRRAVAQAAPLLLPAVLAVLALPARAQDQKTLVLRGRVTEDGGAPVDRVRLRVRGGRSANVVSDAGGFFQLELPLGSPVRVAERGLDLRVSADKPGWRFGLPGGVPALEVRVRCAEAGACSLTASDARVGQALARCFEPGGPPGAVAPLNFVGARRVVIFGTVRGRGLAGVAGCAVEIREPGSTGVARVTTGPDGFFEAALEPGAGARRVEVAVRHEDFDVSPARREVSLRPADRLGPVLFTAAPRAGADSARVAAALSGSRGGAAVPRSPSEAAAPVLYATRLALPPVERIAAAPVQPAAPGGLPAGTPPPASVPAPPRAVSHAASGGKVTRDAKPPSKPPAEPSVTSPGGDPAILPARLAAEQGASAPPAPAGAKPTPRDAAQVPRTRRTPPKPARETPASPAPGAPAIPAPVAPPVPAAPRDPNCRCLVRGIVDLSAGSVVTPAPRIEVSLAPNVGAMDTVAFYMGAPRSFTLDQVPCGRYRVNARNLGRARWVVVNPQGVPEVHCEPGSETEIRLLLEQR